MKCFGASVDSLDDHVIFVQDLSTNLSRWRNVPIFNVVK